MKALALILVLLVVGDVALDHGAGVLKVGQASQTFTHDFAEDFASSLFAA